MAAISFQQNIVRVVHLEVVQGGPLNTLIPNTCLQQPMSGESGLPPRYLSIDGKLILSQNYKKKHRTLQGVAVEGGGWGWEQGHMPPPPEKMIPPPPCRQ